MGRNSVIVAASKGLFAASLLPFGAVEDDAYEHDSLRHTQSLHPGGKAPSAIRQEVFFTSK